VPEISKSAVDSTHPGLAIAVTSYKVSGELVMSKRKDRLRGELDRRCREEERR